MYGVTRGDCECVLWYRIDNICCDSSYSRDSEKQTEQELAGVSGLRCQLRWGSAYMHVVKVDSLGCTFVVCGRVPSQPVGQQSPTPSIVSHTRGRRSVTV